MDFLRGIQVEHCSTYSAKTDFMAAILALQRVTSKLQNEIIKGVIFDIF